MASPTTPIQLDSYASWLRCPKTSCADYGKRLLMDIGQDADGYDGMQVTHRCIGCGYRAHSPRTVAEARHSDVPQVRAVHESLREALLRQRLEGVVVALRYDDEPWAEEEWTHGN